LSNKKDRETMLTLNRMELIDETDCNLDFLTLIKHRIIFGVSGADAS